MLRIYFMLKAQYIKTAMEYKLNFWMMVIAGIIIRTLIMGVAYVLFQYMPSIAGFTENEVYLIMAFFFISEGLCSILFEGIWHIPALVFNGELDVMLSRPISPMYQILSYEVGLQGIGTITLGIISLIFTIVKQNWLTPFTLLLCIVFIICGTVLRLSCYIIGSCYIFWFNAGGQVNVLYLINSVGGYARYPVDIYPIWMQAILYFFIPYALIGHVPTLILRGEHVLSLSILLIIVVVLFFILARFIFSRSIQRYESMGM